MEIILAILIYLQLLISPGTYTQVQIDDLISANEVEIDRVRSNPAQMDIVEQFYLEQAANIIIINETELD